MRIKVCSVKFGHAEYEETRNFSLNHPVTRFFLVNPSVNTLAATGTQPGLTVYYNRVPRRTDTERLNALLDAYRALPSGALRRSRSGVNVLSLDAAFREVIQDEDYEEDEEDEEDKND